TRSDRDWSSDVCSSDLTAFPRGKLGSGLLEKIVSGGATKLGEAGVPVVGGHSVDDPEPKFGYTVIGEVHPDRMVGHEGAKAGDRSEERRVGKERSLR